ncbi:SMC-Scp complex subunit ScpB [Candidatus Woesearchaeota archaeon]|nr:SMC-Scp complex subunit ScpB [Candidatus Woesearchaeota archaeon]
MDDAKGADLKNRIEAILFSSGRKMNIEELAKLSRSDSVAVLRELQALKGEYGSKDSSLLLLDEGSGWKLTVREQYANVVRRIVAETELTRSVMETLAVIAWKAPVMQSDIIKIRTNKAYDHLAELETSGFISRAKHGRTKLVKLTDRFFNYFDLKNAEEIKEKFKVEEAPAQQTPASGQQQ